MSLFITKAVNYVCKTAENIQSGLGIKSQHKAKCLKLWLEWFLKSLNKLVNYYQIIYFIQDHMVCYEHNIVFIYKGLKTEGFSGENRPKLYSVFSNAMKRE